MATINEDAAAHQVKVQAGEAKWSDENDDGELVYDHGEFLGDRMYDAEQVLALIRNSFVITLHHFVEQRIGAELPNKKYEHQKAMNWLKAFGWTPSEIGLNELRLAANCAKHSEGSSADQLYALRPDMFDADLVTGWGAPPSYESLKLTDAHVAGFFDDVEQSVPKMPPAL